VGDPVALQRVDERLRDRFLPDEVCELLGPVAAGQYRIVFAARSSRGIFGSRGGFLLGHRADF